MQYIDIISGLNKKNVRYLIVGGIAVNLHGIQRATADIDLIVALDAGNVSKFADVMDELGYRPKVPVKTRDFAIPENRKRWIEEKNMVVFSFYHPKDPLAAIDVFVEEPLPFVEMNARREVRHAFGEDIPIASIADMIALKEKAGRPKDLYDLNALKEAAKYFSKDKK